MSTRDLFTLKLMLNPAEQDAWVAADTAARRSLLDVYAPRDPRTYLGPAWTSPRRIDTMEWFARPRDLCSVALELRRSFDGPVKEILALNSGIPDAGGLFSYVGFKGGSEPGVLTMTFVLQRKLDQKWRFFSIAFNDREAPIDEAAALNVVASARDLLGR